MSIRNRGREYELSVKRCGHWEDPLLKKQEDCVNTTGISISCPTKKTQKQNGSVSHKTHGGIKGILYFQNIPVKQPTGEGFATTNWPNSNWLTSIASGSPRYPCRVIVACHIGDIGGTSERRIYSEPRES